MIRGDGIGPPPGVTREEFMANPEVPTSIIAVLVGMVGAPPPELGQQFGADIKAHNLRSDDPFGQELKEQLLPAVQHDDTVGLLGVAPHIPDHGVF
jgi:hypothetical protein